MLSSNNLTVWCVCVGEKYHSGYVYALKKMVSNNLTIPHDFVCITTRKLPGIQTRLPPVPYQGWWGKLGLFYPRVSMGPSIYLDLDVVITGNIDYLADYTNTFSAPANWAQSGHGGIQSSVMAWPGNWYYPYEKLQWPQAREQYWGDQEYLWDLLGDNWQRLPGVCSYKYHCRGKGVPEDKKIIVFHGKPDPHEVNEPWLLNYTQILRSHISGNTPTTLNQGLSVTA